MDLTLLMVSIFYIAVNVYVELVVGSLLQVCKSLNYSFFIFIVTIFWFLNVHIVLKFQIT